MYMTHNAKSLSQGLWEFPENENTTFLAIRHLRTSEFNSCWHYKEVTLVMMPSFLSYAVYGVTMWLQAGRLPNSKAISQGGRGIFCQYPQTCHSEMSSKVLPTNPCQWSPERWPGTPCTSLDGAPRLWPTATQFQNLDCFVRDGVIFAHICHPPLPMKSTYCPSWRLIFLAPYWPSMPNDAGSLSHTATLPCPVLAHLKALYLWHLEATKASELTLRVVNKPNVLETQPTWSMLLGCDLKHGVAFVLTSQRLEFQVLQASSSALEFWVPMPSYSVSVRSWL